MKLWVDECLSPTLVARANRRGYWATCNRDRNLLGVADKDLHELVIEEMGREVVANRLYEMAPDELVAQQINKQASLDLLLYIVFFIPGVIALTYAGYFYAAESWAINEHSNVTADGPPVYPFKTIIPIAGAFLFAQGLVEIVRCIICLRQGDWPSREQDVEEVDVEKLKKMVHVTDADIQAAAPTPEGAK